MEEVNRRRRTVLQVQVEELHRGAQSNLHRPANVDSTLALVLVSRGLCACSSPVVRRGLVDAGGQTKKGGFPRTSPTSPRTGHFQAFFVFRAESFGRQNVPVCPGPGTGRSVPALGRCCQRNEVCLEAWIFCWSVLSLVCRRLVLRFAVHFSHLDRFVIAGFGQSLQSPSRLASSRLAWATRRCMSLRSDVWALFWSYCRRACFLASTSSEVGSGRGDACWALCVALRGVLFPACFALVGGLPPALLGFGNGRVNSKVRPTAHSCGHVGGFIPQTP